MMNFRMSKNIGFQVKNIEKAKEFYSNVFGMEEPAESEVNEVEFSTKTNSIYLIPGNENLGPIMEVVVSDLEAAKEHFVENGCEIVRWHGKGKDCYIKDPFGMVFNVWEE
jgi:predicted enzyme related to lactoylglutathione lyase